MTEQVSHARARTLASLYEAAGTWAVLTAASELGVLERLDAGPVSADQVGIDRDRAIDLLDALTAIGVVEAIDGEGRRALLPNLCGMLDWLDSWSDVTTALRGGASGGRADPSAMATPSYETRSVHVGILMEWAAERAALELVDMLPIGGHVLDAGAGTAPWSRAICARRSDCHVTAVDVAAVMPALSAAAGNAGMADRFELVGGDIFSVDLSAAPDLVIVANLCHLFDEGANRRLLSRLAQRLAPGGHIAVLELLRDDGSNDPLIALYRLDLSTRARSGGITSFADVSDWLRVAGCEVVARIELGVTPPISMVVGSTTSR